MDRLIDASEFEALLLWAVCSNDIKALKNIQHVIVPLVYVYIHIKKTRIILLEPSLKHSLNMHGKI